MVTNAAAVGLVTGIAFGVVTGHFVTSLAFGAVFALAFGLVAFVLSRVWPAVRG
jgi:hypothetical protein